MNIVTTPSTEAHRDAVEDPLETVPVFWRRLLQIIATCKAAVAGAALAIAASGGLVILARAISADAAHRIGSNYLDTLAAFGALLGAVASVYRSIKTR
jgi:hypothetical protein